MNLANDSMAFLYLFFVGSRRMWFMQLSVFVLFIFIEKLIKQLIELLSWLCAWLHGWYLFEEFILAGWNQKIILRVEMYKELRGQNIILLLY